MSSSKKPVVTDERKINIDGREYTLAEAQALYDALHKLPGIRQHVVTIEKEKIVERDRKPWEIPYVPPRPYFEQITPTAPGIPTIWCGSTEVNSITAKDDGTRSYNVSTEIKVLA